MTDDTIPTVLVRSELGVWAPAWDALVERLPLPSPFLRSWWLETTSGPRPRFLLVVEGETLAGGLALQEERWLGVPRLRMMGSGRLCPDHLDLVAAPDREQAVVKALAAWLGRPGSRILDLEGVAATARVEATLPGKVRRQVIDAAPWAPLPSDPEQWFATRSRNFRANLRKASRRLDEDGVTHRIAPPAPVDASLDSLRRLHAAHWGDQSGFLTSFAQFAAAARTGADRGELLIHELVNGDEVIAAVAAMETADRLSLYQSGRSADRRWRNATTILLARAVQDACRRGLAEVDLLRGGEAYKHNFASSTREIAQLRAATGGRGRLALWALVLGERARRQAGALLRRLGLRRPAGHDGHPA
jgi:CelD/BcsL family acetyltransferase involved in cellulose biosynthesis